MKIRIPYVVVTAVKDKAFFEIVFPDSVKKRTCSDRCKEEGYKVLSTRSASFEAEMPMDDATCEVLFHEVCKTSEASFAYDPIENKIIPYDTEKKEVEVYGHF